MLAVIFVATTLFCTTAMAAQPATAADDPTMTELMQNDGGGFHQVLKTKFIEGNASFMSLVAATLADQWLQSAIKVCCAYLHL